MKKLNVHNKKAPALPRVLFAIFLSSILYPLSSNTIHAQTRGFNAGGKDPEAIGEVATIKGFEAVFSNIVTVALELGGVILFIMFLVGGFKYLTSQGDPKALEGAKGTITHAIIGLVVLILAFVFLVIIQTITGANVTNFQVRQ